MCHLTHFFVVFYFKYVNIFYMRNYIVGKISKIIFESNSGPYKVGLFMVRESYDDDMDEYVDKIIGFTGNFAEINSDVDYILYGKMVNHPKYGYQYNVDSYEIKPPSDLDSLVTYLSSGMFKGIGEKTAKKIVDRFGSDTIDVIKNDTDSLVSVSGMTLKKAMGMKEVLMSNELNQELVLKLNTYGFTVKEAIDLINIYGFDILNIINDDIYELVGDISFDKLDMIFLSIHDEMHEYRIKALIKHCIYTLCFESGDTIIAKEEVFIKMKRMFKSNFNSDIFLIYLNKLLDSSEVVLVDDFLCLYEFYDTEKNIFSNINRISGIRDSYSEDEINEYISKYEKKNGIVFGEEQREAIVGAILNNFYIITGGPGTGKTTIIKAIVNLLQDVCKIRKEDIALLAPIGRSAKRMMSSVGVSAYTIHKFLKWNKENGTFQMDEYNRVNEKVIIVDEASMIDIFLFNSLLKALKLNVKLLLIGDANQLPSIGPGDILHDLLHMDHLKNKCLKTIYRVKDGSYITYLASDIRDKKHFDVIENHSDFTFINALDDEIISYLKEICLRVINKGMSIDNFQILVPMYKGLNGIDNINSILAEVFNGENEPYKFGEKYYRVNDKVIQLVNDVDNNVFNGDIGYIKNIVRVNDKTCIMIDFSGNEVMYTNGDTDKFSLAYAISIHKSQGSEYDNVVVLLANSFKRMFYNKLIYTAVTRAKTSLIIIGSLDSLNNSIQTLYAEKRNTYLKHV